MMLNMHRAEGEELVGLAVCIFCDTPTQSKEGIK
jgi:hypothetical protein